jgi:hypothetical protein
VRCRLRATGTARIGEIGGAMKEGETEKKKNKNKTVQQSVVARVFTLGPWPHARKQWAAPAVELWRMRSLSLSRYNHLRGIIMTAANAFHSNSKWIGLTRCCPPPAALVLWKNVRACLSRAPCSVCSASCPFEIIRPSHESYITVIIIYRKD